MINFFNRKELFITFKQKEDINIKNILDVNGIEYYAKCLSRNLGARGTIGSLDINSEYLFYYKIYVKRSDYEKAHYLISK